MVLDGTLFAGGLLSKSYKGFWTRRSGPGPKKTGAKAGLPKLSFNSHLG